MKFGKAIRICRAVRGISQKDLAARAKIRPSYVSLIEAEKRAPSIKTIEKIAAGLSVPVHLIMMLAAERDEIVEGNVAKLRGFASAMLQLLSGSESDEDGGKIRS